MAEEQTTTEGAPEAAAPQDDGRLLQRREVAPPAEETAQQEAQPSESEKYTALAGRHAQLERKLREEQLSRQQESESMSQTTARLQELERRLKEDPYSLVEENGHTYDNWTAKILQKTPEQEAAAKEQALMEKIEALESRINERDTKRTEERDTRARDENLNHLKQVVSDREDLAYLSKLGQEPILYERLVQHQEKHGECSPEDQDRISRELEAESREVVEGNLRSLATVPHFRELLTKLLEDLPPTSDEGETEEASPAASEPQGEANGNGARTPTSLTQTQTSAGTERKGVGKRSRAERREALYKRLDERQERRARR